MTTVLELVERSSARLEASGVSFGHGATNAFDEAAWLVLWRLGLPLDALDEVAGRAAMQVVPTRLLQTARLVLRDGRRGGRDDHHQAAGHQASRRSGESVHHGTPPAIRP